MDKNKKSVSMNRAKSIIFYIKSRLMKKVIPMYGIDLKKMIETESILIHFHPIISMVKKTILGLEALCRGIHPETKKLIPPQLLFALAQEQNLILELDRLARKKAVEAFLPYYQQNNKLILFLNFNTSVLDKAGLGSKRLLQQMRSLGINPHNVAIEIIESKLNSIDALKCFVHNYKEEGFMIALDDLGSGHSNLDRILMAKPDVIKLDRGLIQDIEKEFYKQKFFKSLVNLSKRIGSLVVAEGVETVGECLTTLEMGADLLQGFYFTQPSELNLKMLNDSFSQIGVLASHLSAYKQEKITLAKERSAGHEKIVDEIIDKISDLDEEQLDARLKELVLKYPFVECVYIIDSDGFQITSTVCNTQTISPQRKLIFHPALKGQDHSLKDYFLFLKSGFDKHTTEPYISLASGNLCLTIATGFENKKSEKWILCIDINS